MQVILCIEFLRRNMTDKVNQNAYFYFSGGKDFEAAIQFLKNRFLDRVRDTIPIMTLCAYSADGVKNLLDEVKAAILINQIRRSQSFY